MEHAPALDDVQEPGRADLPGREEESLHPARELKEQSDLEAGEAQVPDAPEGGLVNYEGQLALHRRRELPQELLALLGALHVDRLVHVLAQPETHGRGQLVLRHERIELRHVFAEGPSLGRNGGHRAEDTDEVAPDHARQQHDHGGDDLLHLVEGLRRDVTVADRGDRHHRKVERVDVELIPRRA